MPGYYISAFGVTTTFAPTDNFYLSYGLYDGNLATGSQTGTKGPEFNGYYFHIGEVGAAWEIGGGHLPGSLGIGVWNQTGNLRKRDVSESGAAGVIFSVPSESGFVIRGKTTAASQASSSLAQMIRKSFP